MTKTFMPSFKTRAELEDHQLRGLQWTVAHAYNGSRFYRSRLDRAGVKCTRHLAVGHVADTIAHYATRLAAEQVVMGSHGRGALKHALMGSVATDVLRRVDAAVTLVR